jgi:hypothetical protein
MHPHLKNSYLGKYRLHRATSSLTLVPHFEADGRQMVGAGASRASRAAKPSRAAARGTPNRDEVEQ